MLDQITPVILTRDEEANIARTLAQLTWANEVLVVDSFSRDKTLDIARTFPNVRIVQREFDTFAAQSLFGIAQSKSEWVLLLDADYFVPDAFTEELRALKPRADIGAYIGGFDYAIGGRKLRASLYPPRIVLVHRDRTTARADGHTTRFESTAGIATLRKKIIHDDRKSFARFLERQKVYMRQEAEKIRTTSFRALPMSGRVRKLIFIAPIAVVLHTLFAKRVIFDGRAGLWYTWERLLAELILSRELLTGKRPSS